MKNNITILFSILFFSFAQAQISRDETLIRDLDIHNAATLVKNDTAAIKKYLAQDFLINGSNNKISFGGERIVASMRAGRVKYSLFDVITDTVYFLDDNTAVSMGSETVASGSEGSLNDQLIKRRYTNIWIKEKNIWKLKFRHSSIICAN